MPCLAASSARVCLVAADEDRLDLHASDAVGEQHAALLADREDRAHEVLAVAHAAGCAVHDDADGLLVCHGGSSSSRERGTIAGSLMRKAFTRV